MGYKTILVHCDATAATAGRLKVAVDLARRFDGHVVGLHVRQPFQAPMLTDAGLAMDALYSTYEQAVRSDEAVASATFAKAVAGGTSSEWRACDGRIVDLLVDHARYADLVIVGQYEPEGPPMATPADLVEQVAMTTERPVLAVPYIGALKPPGNNVMVCWNDSREAVRATTGALPVLKTAARVSLLTIDPVGPRGGGDPAADLVQWLARHGVTATVQRDSAEGSTVGGVILSRAADLGADLIVMGVYGHSRMRELVLGGASRTLLASMTVPLLLAH